MSAAVVVALAAPPNGVGAQSEDADPSKVELTLPVVVDGGFIAHVAAYCKLDFAGIDADVLVGRTGSLLAGEAEVRTHANESYTDADVRIIGRVDAGGTEASGTIDVKLTQYGNDVGRQRVEDRCRRKAEWRADVGTEPEIGQVISGGPRGTDEVVLGAGPDTIEVLSLFVGRKIPQVVAHADLDRGIFRWTKEVPHGFDAVGAGDDAVWVGWSAGAEVMRLGARHGKRLFSHEFPDPHDCCDVLAPSIAVMGDAVYLPGSEDPDVVRIDARTNEVERVGLELADEAPGDRLEGIELVATRADELYLGLTRSLLRVDPDTGVTLASRSFGEDDLYQVLTDDDALWVVRGGGPQNRVVDKLDPTTLETQAQVEIPPGDVALGAPGFWVAYSKYRDVATKYDGATLAPVGSVALRGDVVGVDGRAWLWNRDLGALLELLP